MSDKLRAPAGGSFLIAPSLSHDVFIPNEMDDELMAFAQTAEQFMQKDVIPLERELETKEGKERKLAIDLLRKAADIGLCMIDIPEKFGGLDMGVLASMIVTEKLGVEPAFSVTFGAHAGIGTIPIIYFGNEEQKEKYLPRLATGEIVGAYCLSEPNSGSDALGAQTRAVLNEAGTHYVLNGTKMWITNGAWADNYIIFAKVDGEHFTGFIVERDTEGVSSAPEEHKLGLKGSSTTQILLEDAHVPVENLLGQIGKGHHIAFHTLNVGRFKLGCGALGSMKRLIEVTVDYAGERKQFKTPILKFGAIRSKIADMTTATYVSESLSFRIGGYMNAMSEGVAKDDPAREDKLRNVIEEYVIESSIAKVYVTEATDRLIDECLQVHGGMGFVEECIPEKFYRDARVNRIFEGTNEINRLLIPGMLLKRAMKGRLDLLGAIQNLEQKLESETFSIDPSGTPLEQSQEAVEIIKATALMTANAVLKKHMADLDRHQDLLMNISNIIIQAYGADSALHRSQKLFDQGTIGLDSAEIACTALFASEGLDIARTLARATILSTYSAEDAKPWLARLAKLDTAFDVNRVALRKTIADATVEAGRYSLSSY